jgi:hypothetical protein
VLVDYDERWRQLHQREADRISGLLGDRVLIARSRQYPVAALRRFTGRLLDGLTGRLRDHTRTGR